MQLTRESAFPMIEDFTAEGQPVLRKEDIKPGAILPRKVGEPVEVVKTSIIPPELTQILSTVSSAMQRGGLPFVIYGGLPFELSGFALSQLLAATRHKLAPYVNGYSSLLSAICVEYLRQFKKHGKSIKLITENTERRGKGETFIEEFKPSDIPTTKYVEISIPLSIPTDKAQNMMLARQAITPPQLASRLTIWDEYLDIQDAKEEMSRIIDDSLSQLPVMQTIMLLERLKEKADYYRALGNEPAAVSIEKYIVLVETQSQQSAPKPSVPGIKPSILPAEAQGMPTEAASMMGQPPTGEAGQPARPGE